MIPTKYNKISANQHLEKMQYILKESTPFFNTFDTIKLRVFRTYADYKEKTEQDMEVQADQLRKIIANRTGVLETKESSENTAKADIRKEELRNDYSNEEMEKMVKERNNMLEETLQKVEEIKSKISNLNFKEFTLSSLTESALYAEQQKPQKYTCLHELALSSFSEHNIGFNRNGDLVYIQVKTLEGKELTITGSEKGFFINSSTQNHFNPLPLPGSSCSYTLAGLLCQISNLFRENFGKLLSQKVDIDSSFFAQNHFYRPDWLRKEEDPFFYDFKVQPFTPKTENVNNFTEWNEEWQLVFDLNSSGDFNEKLQKDKLLNDRYIKFVSNAKKGVEYLADNKLATISFFDTPNMGLFLYDNIFLTVLEDRYLNSQVFLDETQNQTFVGANLDLRHLSYLNQNSIGLKDAKFYFPMACVITFRGLRVHAQTIIPGIMFNSEVMVKYGQLEEGVLKREENFATAVKELTDKLHIASNNMFDNENKEFEFHGHPELKAVQGYDNRKYLFDLVHIMPRDPSFEGNENDGCIFRPEIIREFRKFEVESKLIANNEVYQQISTEIEDLKRNLTKEEDVRRLNDLIAKRKGIVDSVYENYKEENKLNTCLFTNVKLSENNPDLKKQASYLHSISNFIREKQIPRLIKDIASEEINIPADCAGISSYMHRYGISLRYYGEVEKQISSHNNKRELQWIITLIQRDVLMRSAKHVCLEAIKSAGNCDKYVTASHLLNLLFAHPSLLQTLEQFYITKGYSEIELKKKELKKEHDTTVEEKKQKNQTKKHKKKVKKVKKNFPEEENKQFVLESLINTLGSTLFTKDCSFFISPSEFWEKIAKISYTRFGLLIENKPSFANLDSTINKFGLLRDLCLKIGIQIRAREYDLERESHIVKSEFNYSSLPFSSGDIVTFFAVVKESRLPLTVSEQVALEGDHYFKLDNIPYAIDKYSQSIYFREEVIGQVNPQSGAIYRKLANIFYNTTDIVMVSF